MASEGPGSVGGIQGHLIKLHGYLIDSDARLAALRCHDIIGDLGQECMVTKSENELVLQASLLFAKEEGLLSFLRKSLSNEELRDARVDVLHLLDTFLQRMSTGVKGWEKTYAIDLKDVCMVVYTKDKAAKCRAPALELLVKILYLTKDSTIGHKLQVGDMFNKFYGELAQKTKIPDTVLGNIYELLGVLGEVHPSEMVPHSDKLYRAYLGELKGQMTSSTKEPKLQVVAGCLRGITALMVNFTKSMDEDPTTSKEIFDYALKSISPQSEMKRYAVTFAGLRLFAKHAVQFSSCLMDHYRQVFEVMSKLCGHINVEMKKTSYHALESFLKQVAVLVADNIEQHKSKLKFFMQKFCAIIKTMDSSNKELSIAIRGYGLFAAPCKVVCPQDVDLMYTELMQRCKQMYLTESDRDNDNIYQLPSFLDSIASVLVHLDKIPEVYTPVLERLLVVQMDSFPQYSQRMQHATCRAIIKVIVAMAAKGPMLWSFISSVVHQGLIRVCSKPIPQLEEGGTVQSRSSEEDGGETTQVRTGKWKVPSCRDYLDLFRGILDCENLRDTGFLDGALESQNANLMSLNRLLYDEVVKSIMKIIEKLDLSVQRVNTDEEAQQGQSEEGIALVPSSDPTAHLIPSRPKDFTAFINLVDFSSELLSQRRVEYFEQWMHPLSHHLILHSIRFPLVSGFYRLLSLAMNIAKRIHYFQGVSPKSYKSAEDKDPVKCGCFALVSKFGKEVSVRIKQYKDELLAACLTFVLSLHYDIVALDIKAYIPALQAALRLGLSHAPLATAALDALELWSSHIPRETMQPHYGDILPHLDGYLKTAAGDQDVSGVEVMCLSSGSEKGYGKVMMRLLKKAKRLPMGDESPIAAVRRRVVRLLGHLGGQLNRSLVTAISAEDMMKKFVAWDSERRLSFAVPFSDMKPVIYLDCFLPRITELALTSSDRQTKVAACELLHTLVVYMVGKGAQMVEGDKSSPPMYNLHKRVFPVLLRLACDVDQVTRQLFEPLVMQLIHWFTNNKKFESQDTVAVLEAILDGVIDPLDSTLRDFSGRCIQEFVRWSIKQTTPKQQEKSPANIKSLFKRIYSLALHPNVFKRLGAALAFNSIYRQFREESSLVEQFVFEVLVVFVESMALAHADEKSMGTVQQCSSALEHLKRIIKHKAASLSQTTKRRVPRGFPPDVSFSLSEVVLWLLEQCGRPQTECRHKCMELFYEFVPLLPGKSSPAQWLDQQVKSEGVGFLVSRLEGGGLLSQPSLRSLQGPFSVRVTLQWMDALLAALDCYNTFTGLKLIQPQHILGSADNSSFLAALHFFLTELAGQDLDAAECCFHTGAPASLHSPRERELYSYSKCTIIVRLLEFTTMVLGKCQQDTWQLFEADIFNPAFFELVAMTVSEPSCVGFDMADLEVMTHLPQVCVPLLKALATSPYRHSLETILRKRISAQSVEDLCSVDLYDPDTRGSHAKTEMMLSACKQLHQAGLLTAVLHNKDASYSHGLGSRLLLAVYKGIAPGEDRKSLPSMDVGSRKLAEGLVQLSFSLGGQSEQVVGLLLNTISLSVPLSGSLNPKFLSFSHGEYFYSLFHPTINTELLRCLDTTVPLLLAAATQNSSMVSILLNGMLDHSFRERSVRRSQGSRLAEQILQRWESLRPWWGSPASSPQSKTATLTLLSKVLQIDSSVCSNTEHQAFQPVFTTFTTLIVDMSLPLDLKSQALIMLPFFTVLPAAPLAELQRNLEVLVASHFPMQSDELPRGSLQCNNYMDCVRKFLDALELSQSPMLLKLMAGVLCRDKKHIMEDLFQTCFLRIARRSTVDRQLDLLSAVYKTFREADVPVRSMLLAVVDRVLLPLATHCSPRALSLFFVTNISDVMTTLQVRASKSVEAAFESQVMMKRGLYKLMELLYSRLPKEELYSKESQINQAFCGAGAKAEGNELSKNLLKSCFEAFTENMTGETQLLELRRQLHCAAYNCTIALICCSFNETKFYQGFLFTEKPEKNQLIFDNLLDIQRTYNFPIEIDVPIERKKKYVMIRKEVSGENGDAPVYLSSQSYMADSSLSEEMSQFDFSTGVQSFSYSSQNPSGHSRAKRTQEQVDSVPQEETVELEMDELNQHECMASMTALLNHMQRNNITPRVPEGTTPPDLPPWMKFLHGKLSNPSTPLNIRLFIAKLIINTEEVFRPYAKQWLGPLLQLVVSGNNGGEGIHFMVVDIVVTVLSWTNLATPKGNTKDEVLANRLLEFLMRNCFNQKRPVFRHNLEIIRTVVECWKDSLHVPYGLIYERFAGTDPNSKDNSVGLQLLGIVLANNLPPYDIDCSVSQDRYFQSLATNLGFIRYKEVFSAAAEIIGLILNYQATKNQHDESLFSLTVSKLSELNKKSMDDKFVIGLSKVCKHFPPLVDRFVNIIFFLLPKLHGILKTHCLECVASRAEVIPEIYTHLKTKDFTQIMTHRDEARQRVCLDIVHKLLAVLKPVELRELLPAVTSFTSHPSPICRERMYHILMWIQDNYSDTESKEDQTSLEVLNTAKDTLLQGLTDDNAGLQLYVRNFWSHERRLPGATLERMLVVLQSLYSPFIEERFLSLATDLLLERTSQSPDYTRNMFEYPLSECKFQDYMVDANWRLRSTVLTPMFVETQASQSGSGGSAGSQASTMGGQVRATQASLEFSQTQAAGSGRRTAYNWLTGSSVDTLAEYSLPASESMSSSLLVFGKRDRPPSWKTVGAGFGAKSAQAATDETDSRSAAARERRADILRLKRRFLKDQEKVSLHFAKKEISSQRQEKVKQAEQKIRRDAQVTLYRSYRVGDLPDIQIQHSSLIAPLQALAQRDATLAKQLFSALFSGILEEMDRSQSSGERRRVLEDLLLNINLILNKSTAYFPPFVACVQDMSYQHRELLGVQPAAVSSSCLASLQQPMGILLLEESLLRGPAMPDEPPSKRARGGRRELPPDTERWIHLAKLYRSLGDYDVVRGVFGGKIGTKAITCTALQAEAKGDYAEAVKLYNEAINIEEWRDGDPLDAEKDFWEIAALDSYSHLTEWKSLQYCATVNIDDSSPVNLDKMWSDPFYQENYLPYMMRSMLKQLQLGDRDQALLSFVDSAMKDEKHKVVMETHYSQELSLLYVLQEDYDRAKYYANSQMQVFMQNYSSIDPLLNQSRLTVLQSVQALTEIQDFLHFITGNVSVASLKNLIRHWTARYPDAKMDPMNVWDDIITTRCFFLDKILQKLQVSGADDSMEVDGDGAELDQPEDLEALVKDCKFSMKLRMADSAWKQNCFPVSTKLLKELHREAKSEEERLLRWVHSFSRFTHRRSTSLGPSEQIGSLLKTIPLLEDTEKHSERSGRGRVYRSQRILMGTSFSLLANAIGQNPSALEAIGQEKADRLLQYAEASSNNTQVEVVEKLQLRALELLRSATRRADEEVQSFSEQHWDTSGIIEAHITLANFCDKILREEEQKEEPVSGFAEQQGLAVCVVESMLKALRLNSEEARLQFPRLLQLVELYPAETLSIMAKEVVTVPCWQLIGWISQMMALLDKREAVAVQQVIREIAESYPQALVYPYMISSENYCFEETAEGHKNKEFVDRLKPLLDKGGVIQDFVDALQQLTNPEMLFKDWWDEVKNQLEKPSLDKKKMRALYDAMFSSLCDSRAVRFGAFRKKFTQKFSKEVEKVLGTGCSKLFEKRKDKPYLRQVDELTASMRGFQKEPGNLKEYSPWLSNFKPDTLGSELEIPGQYDGRSKPLPEYHAKITGFDERVKVMTSIRRPKRLVIRGDDEKEYPFLVKGGEDLRQDQRIEQLFGVMNILLHHDTACSQRNMQLRTYQVVPITSRIGLIEWMENTCTLKDFLASRRTEEEQKTILAPNEAYGSWLHKIGRDTGIRQYAESYKKANRTETINNFRKIEQMVPEDLLRRAFVRMSTTPEAFLTLRSHFAGSHALLCVSQWLLGIGDRHLSNFMINTETGGMIGIDFGHAFGSATQFLPVPELMPFRLTRQFVQLMRPLQESGLIRSVMVHALRAFRQQPDLLLNTMDVFVKEPSLDWKNFEMKQLKKGGKWMESVDVKEINWYPLQKVSFARRKLEGANPAVITSEELLLGFEKDPAVKGMLAVARGSEEHNVRAQKEDKGLSAEDQVDCLLDQATDPNLLGRVWVGWEPWV